jgi:hypothetical protein
MIERLLLDYRVVRVIELQIKIISSTLTRMFNAIIGQILSIQSDHITLTIIDTGGVYVHGDS